LQLSSSGDDARPLRGFGLHWSVAHRLADQNVRWYDLGGGNRDPGLRQFKKGFVGRAGTVVPLRGEFARWQGLGARIVADALHLVRNAQLTARALRI
jgi:lipid II:glycine glycyltransferase (peptidoglycan interpeptide bridge formation enzyme)